MDRRDFLKNTGMLAAGLALLGNESQLHSAETKAPRPNIILILVDDMATPIPVTWVARPRLRTWIDCQRMA